MSVTAGAAHLPGGPAGQGNTQLAVTNTLMENPSTCMMRVCFVNTIGIKLRGHTTTNLTLPYRISLHP